MITYSFGDNLYINLTNRCTNHCAFCDKGHLQKVVNADLKLKYEPTAAEIISEVKKKEGYKELVFCGVGEPTLKLDVILEVLRAFPKKDTRLNTCGHAYCIYPDRMVAKELKSAGLKKINISLNATSKEEYDKTCKPAFPDAYEKMLRFAKDCADEGIITYGSFVSGFANEGKAKALTEKLGVILKIRKDLN
ncbi:MAG: radical SAM protein [Nanoarchaeota archaeon]|nr:radical SAM protein [Nanoarchaeota archaeon]